MSSYKNHIYKDGTLKPWCNSSLGLVPIINKFNPNNINQALKDMYNGDEPCPYCLTEVANLILDHLGFEKVEE